MKRAKRIIDIDQQMRERESDYRGPTLERLEKAADAFEVGDDGQGTKVYFIELRPLSAMLKRRQIDGKQFSALDKFHKHWFNSKLGGGCRSVDLNRVYAPDPFSDYLNASERQWRNRSEYFRAVELLAYQEKIAVTNIICSETMTAEEFGYRFYASPYRARAAGLDIVRGIADKFVNLWGL